MNQTTKSLFWVHDSRLKIRGPDALIDATRGIVILKARRNSANEREAAILESHTCRSQSWSPMAR
eukprot:scaffold142222_cov31-Prasinocladus_malaysianus.AAC.2